MSHVSAGCVLKLPLGLPCGAVTLVPAGLFTSTVLLEHQSPFTSYFPYLTLFPRYPQLRV